MKEQVDMEASMERSAILRAVVAAVLGVGSAVSFSAVNATGYCDVNGCSVTGKPPGGGGGGSGGGGGGGGGGWGGISTFDRCGDASTAWQCEQPKPGQACEDLKKNKPRDCPNPVPMPTGFDFGREDYASGSGMAKAIYFINNQKGVSQDARDGFRSALGRQTKDFARITMSFDDAMNNMTQGLTQACDLQRQWSGRNAFLRSPDVLTTADKRCLQAVDRIIAEANNRQGFWGWFLGWVDRDGISLGDLGIPQTIINQFSPQNSARVKHDNVQAQVMCSNWWKNVQENNCSI